MDSIVTFLTVSVDKWFVLKLKKILAKNYTTKTTVQSEGNVATLMTSKIIPAFIILLVNANFQLKTVDTLMINW